MQDMIWGENSESFKFSSLVLLNCGEMFAPRSFYLGLMTGGQTEVMMQVRDIAVTGGLTVANCFRRSIS